MLRQPHERCALAICNLCLRLSIYPVIARAGVVAVRAVVLVLRVRETAADDHFTEVSEHRADRCERARVDSDTLAESLWHRKVVHAATQLRLLVAGLEPLQGRQAVQCVL